MSQKEAPLSTIGSVTECAREVPYSPYYYLWHLVAVGVIDADFSGNPGCPEITDTVWDYLIRRFGSTASRPATVALIDVGVGISHPNLGRVDPKDALDLATHPFGARTLRSDEPDRDLKPEKTSRFFAELNVDRLLSGLRGEERIRLEELVSELKSSDGVLRNGEAYETAFPSHGTAMAGLVVGEPRLLTVNDDRTVSETGIEALLDGGAMPVNRANLIPYFGVDPFSRLVSIKTSFDADPRQLIIAFLHAWQIGADVILVPRDIPDPVRSVLPVKEKISSGPGRSNPVMEGSDEEVDDWAVLQQLMLAISQEIPIVCAAGNSGESQLIYPARLAGRDGSPNGVIAVGAVNGHGTRSGYSSYGRGLTAVCPSDDGELYTRHQVRIDRQNPGARTHDYRVGASEEVLHCHQTITTTDLPGAWGYSDGTAPYVAVVSPEDNAGFGGYYSAVGGTSAAAAIAAGVIALMARARKAQVGGNARISGPEAKEALMKAADLRAERLLAHADRAKCSRQGLVPDNMNGEDSTYTKDSAAEVLSYFFGAGLVDAKRAVERILEEGPPLS